MSYSYIEDRCQPTTYRRVVDEDAWLTACNGNCRKRRFDASHYQEFRQALGKARKALKAGKKWWMCDHAGTVAKAYGYRAYTAGWRVWVELETRQVCVQYGRYRCNDNEVWWGHLQSRVDTHKVCWHQDDADADGYRIVAAWCTRDGMLLDNPIIMMSRGRLSRIHVPADVICHLPEAIQMAVKQVRWTWPRGTTVKNCERVLRQRMDDIIDMLPALMILDTYGQ